MKVPVVTLAVSSHSLTRRGDPYPQVDSVVERIINAVEVGAITLSQLVPVGLADDVLVGLYHAVRRRNLQLLVSLPSGELLDLRGATLRPARSIMAFMEEAAI